MVHLVCASRTPPSSPTLSSPVTPTDSNSSVSGTSDIMFREKMFLSFSWQSSYGGNVMGSLPCWSPSKSVLLFLDPKISDSAGASSSASTPSQDGLASSGGSDGLRHRGNPANTLGLNPAPPGVMQRSSSHNPSKADCSCLCYSDVNFVFLFFLHTGLKGCLFPCKVVPLQAFLFTLCTCQCKCFGGSRCMLAIITCNSKLFIEQEITSVLIPLWEAFIS